MENFDYSKTIRMGIQADIDTIKSEYQKNVSQYVGKVIRSFVTGNIRGKDGELVKKYLKNIDGLERYVTEKIGKRVALHQIKETGFIICHLLREGNEEALKQVLSYLNFLSAQNED